MHISHMLSAADRYDYRKIGVLKHISRFLVFLFIVFPVLEGSLMPSVHAQGSAEAASPPAPPTGLIATGTDNNITLNWSPSAGAASYNVYRSTTEGGPYTMVSYPGAVSRPHYTDLNLNSETIYYYVVTAVNGTGESGYSVDAIAAGPTPVAPGPPPADDAMFVSQSVPSYMTAGQTYNVSVTMQNTGTSTWAAGGSYQLASQKPAGNATWSPSPDGSQGKRNSVSPTVIVATNSQVTFAFTTTAPTTPGTYQFQWQMAKVGSGSYQYFGEQTDDVAVTVVAAVPTRLTPAQAIQIAKAYCNSSKNPISVPGNAQYSVPDADDAYWQPRWTVTFDGQATVEVVDATGVVASYTNEAYYTNYLMSVRNQPAGPLTSQTTALQTAAAALQATTCAEQTGTPTAYLSQNNDGSHAGDSTWNVLYNRQFQGIPYKDDFVVILIDAGTNQLTGLSLTYRCVPPDNGGSAMVITQRQAEAIARVQLGQDDVAGAVLQSTTKQVILPNSFWQDGGYSFTPGPGKIAWVVTFSISASSGGGVAEGIGNTSGGDSSAVSVSTLGPPGTPVPGPPGTPVPLSASDSYAVWVDAATGNVIGGEYVGEERGRHTKQGKHTKHGASPIHPKKTTTKLATGKKTKQSAGSKQKRHKAVK